MINDNKNVNKSNKNPKQKNLYLESSQMKNIHRLVF